jgi:putative FmdB family regulatory protein
MPIYVYACSACGRRIDVMHGIYGHGPVICEVCGGAMRKALTTPAIHYKGSGWAKKDARAAAAPAAKDESAKGTDAPPAESPAGSPAPAEPGTPAPGAPPPAAPAPAAPAAAAPPASGTSAR